MLVVVLGFFVTTRGLPSLLAIILCLGGVYYVAVPKGEVAGFVTSLFILL